MLYTDTTILTLDDERRIITDGALLVRGDTIAAVGKVTVESRPHRFLARDRIVLGNHRQAMGPSASGAAGAR